MVFIRMKRGSKMTGNIINVVVIKNNVVDNIASFPECYATEAHKLFRKEAEANCSAAKNFSDEDWEESYDDGYIEFDGSVIGSVCLSHSSIKNSAE